MHTFLKTLRQTSALPVALLLLIIVLSTGQGASLAEKKTALAITSPPNDVNGLETPSPIATATKLPPTKTKAPLAAAATATAIPSNTQSATPSPAAIATPTPTPSSTATAPNLPISPILPTPTPMPTDPPAATPTVTPTSRPEPTPVVAGISAHVPVLMYHYLSVPPADADIYRLDLSVTPENFAAQLAYLKAQNYTPISLEDLTYHLAGLRSLPKKPVILTFDDGYIDGYTNAFPLLQKYGFQATFSLVTRPIDFADPRYLSWDNVIEMHAAGMDFGAHTYRHLDLRDRDVDLLVYEILGSKEAIEARINEPVRYFVYPSGQYDQLVIDVVASANFWGALTTQYGFEYTHDERFEMPRIRIRGSDTLETFIGKLRMGD